MRVVDISCRNFRNLENINLRAFDEMNVICGENAQGKTNIIEAIWLFTGAKSFRNAKDSAFLKFDTQKALISLDFISSGVAYDAKIEVTDKRYAEFNGNKLKSPTLLAGKFNAIVFSPNDLSLVKDGPGIRRRFLDTAIGQLYPTYITFLKKYSRAVFQRNKIIRDYKYDNTLSVMLDIFEKEISENGEKITKLRKKYIEQLKCYLPEVYGGLSREKEILDVNYIATSQSENLIEMLKANRKNDMLTGSTSIGPHRDDIEFKINGVSVRIYGSQGQKRSVALSVKLAEAEVIKKVTGEYPVFLLDDVMSELDPERQNYVLNHIKGLQSFLTCCDPSNIANLKKGKIFNVYEGRVT